MTSPSRSLRSLLDERRANVLELRGEKDKTARKMLEAHIDGIDREIAARRETAVAR